MTFTCDFVFGGHRVKGGPKPSSRPRPFFREGFQIQFSPFGKFRTGRAFSSGQPLNFLQIGSRKWGVGVKWKLLGRLGKMAARSDAARQTPPGRPGLQHTLIQPPSDATRPGGPATVVLVLCHPMQDLVLKAVRIRVLGSRKARQATASTCRSYNW